MRSFFRVGLSCFRRRSEHHGGLIEQTVRPAELEEGVCMETHQQRHLHIESRAVYLDMDKASSKAPMIVSVAVNSANPAPTASSAVEAKNEVACCKPVMMLASTSRISRASIWRIHSQRCIFIATARVRLCRGDASISQPRNHQAMKKKASAPPSSQVIVRSEIRSALPSTMGRWAGVIDPNFNYG
ncbi:MAG: hypothetical protein ABL956_10185 [Hyphomonadaceae bacterium]